MNKCRVFYECWQMECCGEAFSIGDNVKWLVHENGDLNTPVDLGEIDYCYEAHSSDWRRLLVLEGKVEEIKILYERYMPTPNDDRLLVPVSGEVIGAERAKGFDRKVRGMEAAGYVVLLSGYTVRAAQKEEVTFR